MRERKMRDALTAASASPAARHVGLLLATYANTSDRCWPSVSTLAEVSGRSERSVREALGELGRLGLIERGRRGPGRSAITQLLEPATTRGPVSAPGLTGSPPPVETGSPPPVNASGDAADRQPAAALTGSPPPLEHPEEHPDLSRGSPAVSGRAGASERTTNISSGNGGDPFTDEDALVEHIRLSLQNGIDGLKSDARCRPPKPEEIRDALRKYPMHPGNAIVVATKTRMAAASEDRAPNIVGLFKVYLAEAAGATS